MIVPRGIRNHNPGNIKLSRDRWQGLAPVQGDSTFFQFTAPTMGIRALARTLITYQDRHELTTVRQMISRWAPPADGNPTERYVHYVGEYMHVAPDASVDMHRFDDARALVEAIIWYENGQQPYGPRVIGKGLMLAGIEPPSRDLRMSRTVRGGQAAVAATVGSGIIAAVDDISQSAKTELIGLLPFLPWLKYALLIFILAGLGAMLWARVDDHRRGLR